MISVCITGINGFVGKHLTKELTDNAIEVIGVGRESEPANEVASLLSDYKITDLTVDWPQIENVDAVVHLAGLAAVGPSFDNPQDYINLNSTMITNLAEFYLSKEKRPRIVVVSSGAVYESNQVMPLIENSEIGFNSPYVVSKVLVENQCAYYRKRGLDIVVVRPFNHIGPGQGAGFLIPDVIAQLSKESITVGNTNTKRDYTDVRDIVRAYRLLATTPTLSHTIYNACSGKSVAGSEIINILKELANKPGIKVNVDKSMVRPTDAPDIYGDFSRLTSDTGWQPEISLEQTLRDCLNTIKA